MKSAWSTFLFGDAMSPRTLGLVRIVLGAALLALNVAQFYTLLGVDFSGHEVYFIEPIWYFKLFGITYMLPIWNVVVFAILTIATLCIMLGYKFRYAVAIAILCIFYLKGVRDSLSGDVHHRYLMWIQALFFLGLSRAGDIMSLDARGKDISPIEPWQATWPLRAAQLYTAAFYFMSAVAKLRVSGTNWVVDGSAVQRMLISKSARWNFTTTQFGYDLAHQPTLTWLLVLATLFFEFSFPLFLFIKNWRLRLAFLGAVMCFHIANAIFAGVNFWLTPFLFIIFFDVGRFMKHGGEEGIQTPGTFRHT